MADPAYAMEQANFAEQYEGIVVPPLFRPFVDPLLDAAGVVRAKAAARGPRVLDVACGTGIVARGAQARVGPAGQVTGLDLSAQMLDVARRCEPGVEWMEGDAQALPFEPGRFDAVLCQQGVQFFPDRAAAVREMRRVLAPGGRVAIAVWCALDTMPLCLALHRVAERELGPLADPRYGFGAGERLETLLRAAGFADVRVETLTLPVSFPDGAAYARMNAQALVGMNPQAGGNTDAQRTANVARIVEASAPVLAAYADAAGGATDVAVTYLATGTAAPDAS